MVHCILADIMTSRNLSARSLSQKARMSRQTVFMLQHDKAKGIEFVTLDKLCKVLNCTPGDLLTFE